MQALLLRQFGDPGLLRVEDVPTPVPHEGEALVRVEAAAINPSDVKNVQGVMHGTTLPRIPGRDFAGTVVAGPREQVGRAVWGTGGDIGFTRDGSHAQYILLPSDALTPKPANLSMDAAGSAGVVFVTAWSALVTAAGVSPGDTVLVFGAAGGVGSAAVQIARARGARVIGGVRLDADMAAARANGADEVVNTASGKPDEAVRSLTGGRGADVVFDTSGFLFAESVEAAAIGGRLPVISAPPDGKATFNLRNIYRKRLRVVGIDSRPLDVRACAALLAEMLADFESGRLKVTPGRACPLSRAAEAYTQTAHGKGRFCLRPNE